MKFNPTILGLIAIFLDLDLGSAAPTWPAATDELEDVMFLNTGYKSRGFGSHVTPCGFSEFGVGRNTAAEFLRLGFHDMANANTFREPRGGIDASIAFELGNGDNIGTGFASSLGIYGSYLNSRLSVADMIALGVYSAVRSCGGPAVPMRGGRTDTDVAGPIGVPQPADGTTVFKSRFVRTGFDTTEMIKLVACGHTLGGVHSANFPDIVPAGSAPNGYALFDTTLDFDTKIVTRYLDGPDTDPLSTGPVVGKRADLAVFVADNNATMQTLRDAAMFNSACSTVLQKMIELVPTAVVLSDIIVPYDVKPSGLQLTLLSGGNQLQFSGDIRVRTTSGAASSVQIVYKDRNGGVGGTITTTSSGTASGFDDTFAFFSFSSNIAASTSIASFTVVVSGAGGTQTYDNNGNGFPVQDSVIIQTPQSCLSGGSLTVVAAVRSGVDAPTFNTSQRVARSDASIPIPQLVANTAQGTAGVTVGSYTLYSATFSVASGSATTYGVSSGTFVDDFKNAGDLGATCATLGGSSSSSSSSSTTTTTTSQSSTTSSSASPTATLGRKQIVGAYTFQGCWTEIPGGRVLSDASFYDYTGMTLEACASNCAAYTWFGVEYGGECYCGNTLNSASTLAAVADCYFVCPGDQYEFCGAGNRLELYKKTSSISTSSTSSTSPTSTTQSTTAQSTTSSSTAVPTLHIVPSVGLYNYYGCWTEAAAEAPGVRTLPSDFFPSDSLTVETCVNYCAGSGYKFAGAEYGRECWCANELTAGANLVPDSDCYFYCAGDQYEYCGAGNRLTIYINNGTIGSGSSSSSSTTTTTTTSSTTTSQSSSTPSTLSTTTTKSSTTTTTPSTTTTLSTTTTKSSTTTTTPSTTTTSSTTTTKPSTTTTSSTTTSKPSTTTSSTTTTKPSTTTSSTTTSKPSTTTSSTTTTKSSTTTSKTTTTTSKTTTTTSKTTTTTSKTTTKSSTTTSKSTTKSSTTTTKPSTTPLKTTAKTTTTTTKTTTKPTTTTSKTTTKSTTTSKKTTTTARVAKSLAPTTPEIKPTIGDYKYHGCRTGTGTHVRALSSSSYVNDAMTLELCASRCRAYKYWGVQYGRECYCGNTLNSGSVKAPGGDKDCYFECPGDKSEWCGAGDRLSVYECP